SKGIKARLLMLGLLKKLLGTAQGRMLKRYQKVVQQVNAEELKLQALTDEELRAKSRELQERARAGASLDGLLPEAYAVVKNCCRRLCGTEIHVAGYNQRWDMIPYDVQVLGAVALYHGSIAEMQTGEGKTLTASMPLYLHALTGKSVHLVTVNDYLAQRDCEWSGAIFRWLGLTTGSLTSETPPYARHGVYQSDIVYGTASEFGFDYLRDNSMAMRAQEQVQRGHYFALVDEIDSILIDEARTPLIISGPAADSRQLYDVLHEQVGDLVRLQRDQCNRLAGEARKTLEQLELLQVEEWPKLSKAVAKQAGEAARIFWLVSKGMPRHPVLMRSKENPSLRVAIDEWETYYHSEQNREEKKEALADLYIIVDERANEYELTDRGIAAWADLCEKVGHPEQGSFVLLDLGHEYAQVEQDPDLSAEEKLVAKVALREEDARRKERLHNLRQMLRAHLLMEKDVEYIIQDQKIVIIDENTGRPQPGRRFTDGLHQAIEAKENCPIQEETQTYATVTLQNYFRLYEKLCGMTGTAMTEALEFKEIYKLEVIEIPTHRKSQRRDADDEIYMTEREKYQAILKEVSEVHAQERPILLGTESVEVSEKLARIFRQAKLPHVVLNARLHAQEAEIIAQAGRRGAITISTNMAGRGTDIKLEPGVADLGGLYVMGTTRHPSRRIDRQLRGRCGRQGDPGSGKFFLSFEDQLLRHFTSPRVAAMLKYLRPPEGEPISASMINKSMEEAQKRVEQRNYMVRKHTLEYDDVMNRQRKEIYSFRNEALRCQDMTPLVEETFRRILERQVESMLVDRMHEGMWRMEELRAWFVATFPSAFPDALLEDDHVTPAEVLEQLWSRLHAAIQEKARVEEEKVREMQQGYYPSEEEVPASQRPAAVFGDACRYVFIRVLDRLWQEHLLAIDHLRAEVGMHTVGQKDPLVEFKKEAFILFTRLTEEIQQEIATQFFRLQLMRAPAEPIRPSKTLSFTEITDEEIEAPRLNFVEIEEEPAETFYPSPQLHGEIPSEPVS
ncbi:MAG: preprotein translocase subunit SecA, partial [Chlamydiia bacterium]